MNHINSVLVIAVVSLLLLGAGATESQAGLGLGVHYLNTLGDLKDSAEFDSSAFGFIASFNGGVSLIRFEVDLEWLPDYAFGKDMIQPQAYAFIGDFIYGGVGIGIGHISGEWQNSPFYALRAGVNISKFDIFTSYRFQSWNVIEDFGSDDLNSLTFGAIFKF